MKKQPQFMHINIIRVYMVLHVHVARQEYINIIRVYMVLHVHVASIYM